MKQNLTDPQIEQEDDIEDVPMRPRIDMLKDKAKRMGISFSPNIGEETLALRIQEAMNKSQGLLDEGDETAQPSEEAAKELTQRERRILARKNAQKLIRVNVMPNDPMRAQMLGELIFTGNAEIGTIGKFVPFGTPKGFHIPEMIYHILKSRTFTAYRVTKDAMGNEHTKAFQRAAFNIEVMKPLTERQIKKIADRQYAAARYDEENDPDFQDEDDEE